MFYTARRGRHTMSRFGQYAERELKSGFNPSRDWTLKFPPRRKLIFNTPTPRENRRRNLASTMAKIKNRASAPSRQKPRKAPGNVAKLKGKGAKTTRVEKKQKKDEKRKLNGKNAEPVIPFGVYDNILLVGEGT
jgi:hypothetical protein